MRLTQESARWEIYGLLAVVAALTGLGPWPMSVRLKAAFDESAEFYGHVGDTSRAVWYGAGLSKAEA